MGIIRFLLLDVLPLLIDMVLPALSLGYGLHTGNKALVIFGSCYFYAVWVNLLFGEDHDR